MFVIVEQPALVRITVMMKKVSAYILFRIDHPPYFNIQLSMATL
jgi:hypothetical protein